MQREFKAIFQISKLIVFKVSYFTCGSNNSPYFATSADKFHKNKRDYSMGGQAQDELLPGSKVAYEFWKKWDNFHLKKLTDEELDELLFDMEALKRTYNYMYEERPDDKSKYWEDHFCFSAVVSFSKQPLKKYKKEEA